MPDRIRVYHPETFEPFDLPVDKANDLRLNKGWTSSRPDTTAEPAVKTVEPEESGIGTPPDEGESWRDSEIGEEIVPVEEVVEPVRRGRRKPE